MRRGPFLFLFAVSGAAALIFEVVWTRLLTLHLGHGLAAASAVLAAFMGGLAAGAGGAGRIAGRFERAKALRVYAGLELVIAVLALLLPVFLSGLQPLLAAAYADGSGGTHAGLHLGYELFGVSPRKLWAVNVCDSAEYFERRVGDLIETTAREFDLPSRERQRRRLTRGCARTGGCDRPGHESEFSLTYSFSSMTKPAGELDFRARSTSPTIFC